MAAFLTAVSYATVLSLYTKLNVNFSDSFKRSEFFTVHFVLVFFPKTDCEQLCSMAELKIHAQSYHQLTWFSQIVHAG